MNKKKLYLLAIIILQDFSMLMPSSQQTMSRSLIAKQTCVDKRGKTFTKENWPDGTVKVIFQESGDIHIKNKQQRVNIYKIKKGSPHQSHDTAEVISHTVSEYNKPNDDNYKYEVDVRCDGIYRLTSLDEEDRFIDALTGQTSFIL